MKSISAPVEIKFVRVPRGTPAIVALSMVVVLPGAAGAAVSGGHHHGNYCPAPESLVPGTSWTRHTLATGVSIAEGQARDQTGVVDMHVLTVNVMKKNLSFSPLMHHVANRSTLSSLSANQPKLVASTNTHFFDFDSGVPNSPVLNRSSAIVASRTHRRVVGLGTNGHVQYGDLWLTGSVTSGTSQPVTGLNVLSPTDGITVYSPAWGSRHVQLPWNATSRYIRSGKVVSRNGRFTVAPRKGRLLVATGRTASSWLAGLRKGHRITLKIATQTTAPLPFTLAFGAGLELVNQAGHVRTNLSCDEHNTQAARTAVGYRNAAGASR